MLEANPNLTYRDVQHIIANTARVNDANDNGWQVNGAGHDVSHKYGFGVIDAGAAVNMAETWTTVDEEISFESGVLDILTQSYQIILHLVFLSQQLFPNRFVLNMLRLLSI